MASNYTVRIHLESYLVQYVAGQSTNGKNPMVFKRNNFFIKLILPKLISKREFEHRKIVENYSHQLENFVDFVLPWQKGKIDIRSKHFVSPLDEKYLRQEIKSSFLSSIELECFKLNTFGINFHGTIDNLLEKYNIDPTDYESAKRTIYRHIEFITKLNW